VLNELSATVTTMSLMKRARSQPLNDQRARPARPPEYRR
jgi:hypothetical protein